MCRIPDISGLGTILPIKSLKVKGTLEPHLKVERLQSIAWKSMNSLVFFSDFILQCYEKNSCYEKDATC